MTLYGPNQQLLPPTKRQRLLSYPRKLWNGIPRKVKWILGLVAGVVVVLTLIVRIEAVWRMFFPPAPTVQPVKVVNLSTAEKDYIPGTSVTHHMLEEQFPFGYVLIRLGDAKWTYEPDQRLIKQNIDWSQVEINPDFGNRVVHWHFPAIKIVWSENGSTLVNGSARFLSPMVVGEAAPARGFVYIRRQPRMLLETLSDDQRHPAFVVGFRIMEDQVQKPN